MKKLAAREFFQGEVDCGARADVAHDGYETLVSVRLRPTGHTEIPDDAPDRPILAGPGQVESLFHDAKSVIGKFVGEDAGIREFNRFYDQRRAEELARVERSSNAAKHVQDSFTTAVQARAVGLCGHRYEEIRLHLSVEMDGKSRYETVITVLPPTAQVVAEPEMATCEHSGRHVPAEWLEACAVSRQRVLSHLLVPSEGSGKRALPKHLARSAITGKNLLRTELAKSAVSGKLAEPERLVTSAISRRKGLPEEIATCDFTGAKVLVDELTKSQVSKFMLRKDQQTTSAFSGTSGHRSEFVKCEVSKDFVLPEETARSDMSGKLLRIDLCVASERPPHRVGARNEVTRCEKTGKLLLCDEVARSAATGKLVDTSLLVTSAVSELRALPNEMVVCIISGLLVLPSEMAICAVTGVRAARDRMVKSATTKGEHYMLPGKEVRSALSNKPMAPAEAYTCPWLGDRLLPQEAVACELTGIRVAPRALNKARELADLRRLLDNPRLGEDDPEIVKWLCRAKTLLLQGAENAFTIRAPTGKLRAVAAWCNRLWIFKGDVGFIVAGSVADGTLNMVGSRYTVGRRIEGRWHHHKDDLL